MLTSGTWIMCCWRERVSEEDPEWDFEQELSPQGGAEEGLGLQCRHYWFYKLDFILLLAPFLSLQEYR